MASKTSVRCKLWREKRKGDTEYWEMERERKRKARRLRSAAKKEHDRALSRKRQTKFRERKKTMSKVNESPLDVGEAIDDSGSNGAISSSSDDATSSPTFYVTDSVSPLLRVPEDMNRNTVALQGGSILVMDAMDDEDCLALLHTVNGGSLEMENTTTIKIIQSRTEEEGNIIKDREDTRQAYFQALQIALSQIDDFDSIKSHCNSYAKHIDQTYPIGHLPTLDGRKYEQDVVASSLYPFDDAPDSHVPIKIGGGGNCLPRIGSLFVFGNENYHVEFRVRIFMELCQFEDTYLDNSFLNRGTVTPLDDIAMTLALYSDVHIPHGNDKCRFAFRQYLKNVLQTNRFSGMWSIFALASVIGVPILSIYPSYRGHNVRQHLHRKVMPRVFRQDDSRIIHIMWTNTEGKQQGNISWTPNHFVAVLPTHDIIPLGRETVLQLTTPTLQTGNLIYTNQTGSNTHEEVLPTDPTSTSTGYRHHGMVDSPTSVFLRDVDIEGASVPVVIDKACVSETVLDQTRHGMSLYQDNSSNTLVDQTDTETRRHEDRCRSHPSEVLVYLCITCENLPLCYKCHLEEHQCHRLADLRAHLDEKESMYLRNLESSRQRLLEEISQRERDHEKQKGWIERKINDMNISYQEQLATWTRNQKETVHERDRKVKGQLKSLKSKLEHFDKISQTKLGQLRSLPVSQRLSAMSVEPQQLNLCDLPPCTKLVYAAGPVDLTEQLGTLIEMQDGNDSAKTVVSVAAANGSVLSRILKENIIGTQNWVGNDGQSTATDDSSEDNGNEGNIWIAPMSSLSNERPIRGFMKTTMEIDQLSELGSLSVAQLPKGGKQSTSAPNQDRLSSVAGGTLLAQIPDEKVDHHVVICYRDGPPDDTTKCNVVSSQAYRVSQNPSDLQVIKSQAYGLSNITTDREHPIKQTDAVLHSTEDRNEITIGLLYKIRLNYIFSSKASMCSAGPILHVWDPVGCVAVRMTKNGRTLSLQYFENYDAEDMCVSPVDNTFWFTCKDGTVRRMTLTFEIEVMFTVQKNEPMKICLTNSGHALLAGDDSDDNFRLTLYTTTGDAVRSTETEDIWGNFVVKCSHTDDIAVQNHGTVYIYDRSLELKNAYDITDKNVNLNDFCFDRRGHIVLCGYEHIVMVDQMTGRCVRNVHFSRFQSFGIVSCDADGDGVLWVLDHLNKELLAIRL